MPGLVLNPLDWTAESFLTLYVAVAATALLLVHWQQSALGPSRETAGDLGLFQIAYLADGPGRVMDTALVGLFEAGAARLERWRTRVVVDHAVAVPRDFRPFLSALPREVNRRALRQATAADTARIGAELVRNGLLATEEAVARYHATAFGILAVPLALGAAKIVVGSQRGHPVGILAVLVLGTALLGLTMATKRPYCTPAGAAALARLRQENARAARAPLDDELPLAFALAGSAVLAGRSYQGWFSRGDSGDGGSSGSDGDGGGGCGGCSP